MRKKFIMILLSVVMVVSMLPATAFAADEATCFIAKGVAGKSQIAYSWTAVDGAAKYKVYQAKCGKKYKLIKTTKGTSLTTKGLTKKKKYKAYVVAVDANGDKIAKTPSVHNALKGGKYSNATRVSATENLLIGVGDSAQLEASITKADSKKTLLWERHISAQIRFISADKTVATVDSTGKVSAVSVGSTYIYAIAASGASAACLVQVGLPIKIDKVAEQTSNIFDGVIPYASWQEAVARAWSFTATIDGKEAKFTAINYSNGKLGFEMSYADGQTQGNQKLGLFKASSPCYDWNIMANTEKVESGQTYYVGGVWATPDPVGRNITLELPEIDEIAGEINCSMFVPYNTWSAAAGAGFSFDYKWTIASGEAEARFVLQKNEDGELYFAVESAKLDGVPVETKNLFGSDFYLEIHHTADSTRAINVSSKYNNIENEHMYYLRLIAQAPIKVKFKGATEEYDVRIFVRADNSELMWWDFEYDEKPTELKKDKEGLFYAEIDGKKYYLIEPDTTTFARDYFWEGATYTLKLQKKVTIHYNDEEYEYYTFDGTWGEVVTIPLEKSYSVNKGNPEVYIEIDSQYYFLYLNNGDVTAKKTDTILHGGEYWLSTESRESHDA